MKVKIIAEPANYWHGDDNLLKALCHESISCQVDFFKLQVYNPAKLGSDWKKQRKRYEQNKIGPDLLKEIKDYLDLHATELICTVNTTDSVELIASQFVSNVKIASGQIHPLLIRAIQDHYWERVFVSTGMIKDFKTLKLVEDLHGCTDELVVMHCVSLYPTHDSECNLSRISALKEMFPNASIGYSDHQMDDLACFVAMGAGATYIEKHISLPACFGPTSEIASTIQDLDRLSGVRKRVERLMGDGNLLCQPREFQSLRHYQGRFLLDG